MAAYDSTFDALERCSRANIKMSSCLHLVAAWLKWRMRLDASGEVFCKHHIMGDCPGHEEGSNFTHELVFPPEVERALEFIKNDVFPGFTGEITGALLIGKLQRDWQVLVGLASSKGKTPCSHAMSGYCKRTDQSRPCTHAHFDCEACVLYLNEGTVPQRHASLLTHLFLGALGDYEKYSDEAGTFYALAPQYRDLPECVKGIACEFIHDPTACNRRHPESAICALCGNAKPVDDFSKSQRSKPTPKCKQCLATATPAPCRYGAECNRDCTYGHACSKCAQLVSDSILSKNQLAKRKAPGGKFLCPTCANQARAEYEASKAGPAVGTSLQEGAPAVPIEAKRKPKGKKKCANDGCNRNAPKGPLCFKCHKGKPSGTPPRGTPPPPPPSDSQ